MGMVLTLICACFPLPERSVWDEDTGIIVGCFFIHTWSISNLSASPQYTVHGSLSTWWEEEADFLSFISQFF